MANRANTSKSEFAKSEPCCCGSGLAYGKCCKSKRVKCLRESNGRSSRTLIADKKLKELIKDIGDEFRSIFGRRYGSRDLLINAGLLYSSAEIKYEFERTAKIAGIPGYLLYAYRETDGLMLTEESYKLATPDDREDWDAAVAAYLEAQEQGVDLNEPQTKSEIAIANLPAFLTNLTVHLGSYCHRAPLATRTNQSMFFQFLLISQCHNVFKVIMNRCEIAGDSEIFSLLRQIYECSLLIASLNVDPDYSASLLAQALAGTEHYPYREKKNGEPDYGRIVESQSGREFESRVSFSHRARVTSTDDYAFFEVIYPDLSSGVHFDSRNALKSFMDKREFLNLGEFSQSSQSIRILVVGDYLLSNILKINGLTKLLKRDVNFMRKRLRSYLYSMFLSFDEDDVEIDENASLFVFICMSQYKLGNQSG